MNMFDFAFLKHRKKLLGLAIVALALFAAPAAHAGKKKKKDVAEPPQPAAVPEVDTRNLVWPDPPDIARIRWIEQYRGEPKPLQPATPVKKKKSKESWMMRVAGIQPIDAPKADVRYRLVRPYGVAIDSKGNIYAADTYVGAVFIFNPESKAVEFVRNGKDARFKALIGVAVDDADRLFVTDSGFRRVFVFDASHKFQATFGSDRLDRPSGVAVDSKNRLLYVTDVLKDNVQVFDLDSFKYVRTIGGPPQKTGDDAPGTFARPTNIAVGPNGDVYVSDTLNGRIQIFDADGTFLSMFGKPGDGPGDFARPKGIALDRDGHIWVADADQNRVKVFDREGHLCAYFGEYGYFPGQFALPSGLAVDQNNRVVVAEQVLDGRLQVFRYTTDAEAAAEQAKRDHEDAAKTVQSTPPAASTAPVSRQQ
jgi:DNA-binding beta-propeller fold protein YncE